MNWLKASTCFRVGRATRPSTDCTRGTRTLRLLWTWINSTMTGRRQVNSRGCRMLLAATKAWISSVFCSNRYRFGNTTARPEESLQGGGSGVWTYGWCRIGTFVNQQTPSVVSAVQPISRHGCHSSGIHDRIVSRDRLYLNIDLFIFKMIDSSLYECKTIRRFASSFKIKRQIPILDIFNSILHNWLSIILFLCNYLNIILYIKKLYLIKSYICIFSY